MPQAPEADFGEKTWDDVRGMIAVRLARVFGRPLHAVEDAASAAMVDLVDYWMHLPSSLGGSPNRNFAYAVQRGVWMGQCYFSQGLDLAVQERPCNPIANEESEAANGDAHLDVPDPAPGPEEQAMERSDVEAARHFLSGLPAPELKGWLMPLIDGLPVEAQAQAEGVTKSAISHRRKAGFDRLVEAAKKAGIR